MASGLVAKKIALFELKPENSEHQCRLKRKHAIRRKKYRGKERRIITCKGTSMIALSTSDEHLNLLKDSDDDTCSLSSHYYHQTCSDQLSASCSALFDLVSLESPESCSIFEHSSAQNAQDIPRSKRFIFKSSGSKDKKISNRLNIIDIDIEIKIEQKEQRNSSPLSVDVVSCEMPEYEPLNDEKRATDSIIKSEAIVSLAPSVSLTTETIRLKASLGDCPKEAKNDRSDYHCTKCSHDSPSSANVSNNEPVKHVSIHNKDSEVKANKGHTCDATSEVITRNGSPEPLYENIFSFVPPPPVTLRVPPLPPRRLFGDSFTTNYSCLPTDLSKERRNTHNLNNKNISSLKNSAASKLNEDTNQVKMQTTRLPVNDHIVEALKIEDTADCCTSSTTNKRRHITDHGGNLLSSATIKPETITCLNLKETTTTTAAVVTDPLDFVLRKSDDELELEGTNHENDDDEPYYEDLYDYYNGSELGNKSDVTNTILGLFRDQLNSLEQNVADEVEYCDCSTILTFMNPEIKRNSTPTNISPNVNCNQIDFQQFLSERASCQDSLSIRSYAIYDDCVGVEEAVLSNPSVDSEKELTDGNVNQYNISSSDDIVSQPKYCSSQIPTFASNTNTATTCQKNGFATNIMSTDYIKSKITKASTHGCWQKVTSSPVGAVTEASQKNPYSSTHPLTSARQASTLSSNLLSMFPSLSTSKTKLVEPKGEANKEQFEQESAEASHVQNGRPSSSSTQVIAENERNVSKTTIAETSGANLGSLYSCGLFNTTSYNGIYKCSKPRFGGRPIIAHPLDNEQGYVDNQEKNNDDDAHICQRSDDAHERNEKGKMG